MNSDYLSIRDAAKATGISAYTLRKMHAAGKLPGFCIGEANFFKVNMPMLYKMIEDQSAANAGMIER